MDETTGLHEALYMLASLYAERDRLAAPFTTTIQALEYDRALATADVDAAIAALQATCKALVLAEGQSVHAGTLSVIHQRYTHWDSKGLERYAAEQPSVLQFREIRPRVVFRYASGEKQG